MPITVLVTVAAGGALGTGLRHSLTLLAGSTGAAVLLINLAGAGVLGVFAGWALRPRATRGHSLAHAFFATGLLGGFTTYSALALEVVTRGGWSGAVYGLGTVCLGLCAAVAGMSAGRRLAGRGERR